MNCKNLNINPNNLNISNFPSKFCIQNYIATKCLSQSKKSKQTTNDNYSNKDFMKNIYYNSHTFNNNKNMISPKKYLKFYTPYKKENLTNRKKGEETRKLPKLKNLIITLLPKYNYAMRSLSTIKKTKDEETNNNQCLIKYNNNVNTIEQTENKYREIIIEKNNLINRLEKQNQAYKNIIEYIKLNYNININDFIDNEIFNENLMTIDHNTNSDFIDNNKQKITENAVSKNENRIMNIFKVKGRENENINKLFEHSKNKSPVDLTLEKKDNGKTIINNNINIFNSIEIKKNPSNRRISLASINMNSINSNKESVGDSISYDKNKSKDPVRFYLNSNLNNGNHKINDIKNNTVNNNFSNILNHKKSENIIDAIKGDNYKTYDFNYKESYEKLKNRTNKLISNLFTLIEYKSENK